MFRPNMPKHLSMGQPTQIENNGHPLYKPHMQTSTNTHTHTHSPAFSLHLAKLIRKKSGKHVSQSDQSSQVET